MCWQKSKIEQERLFVMLMISEETKGYQKQASVEVCALQPGIYGTIE